MNSSPKISIIIPVYNVEKYLRQCLDSVINQTFKDIEIICVNDGSTDSSPEILVEYQNKDNRIKVINKSNSGYGHTMNIGLEEAKGEYIGIVESDDYIELNMYEMLYQKAKENNCDLVRCQYYFYNSKENTHKVCEDTQVLKNKVFCPLEDTTPFFQSPAIWVNIFKKQMIVNNNIKFLETPGASYQDTSFAFKLYASSERFMMIPDALLHYRIDNESSSVNQKDKVFFVNKEYAEIEHFAKEMDIYQRLSKLIPKIKLDCYRWNYARLSKKLKFVFLLRWSKEFRKHFFNKEIDKTMFSNNEYLRILFLVFCPVVFIFRKKI